MNYLRIATAPFAFALLMFGVDATIANQKSISPTPIGTYASGIFDAGGAEIVAHDPRTQRLFVVNAQAATVDVLSIRDPSQPEKIGQIDVTRFGAVANSVAVHEGVVAVAVENVNKTDPGMVVFFNRHLKFLGAVQVGALPDMLTFSPDGRWLLVANEGEPNADYSVDPEGSVSIIDLRRGATGARQSDVRTADFAAFNDADLDSSIRIFGPNRSNSEVPEVAEQIASVAQDLEPEYIAVSHDSRTAWVTCQENNALALIDIRSANVVELVGLGFKDHSTVKAKPAVIYTFDPATLPPIGTTAAGQTLFLGGFSGLWFEGINPKTHRYKFITHTDRGPNAEPNGINRPFLLPKFTPEIVRFELDRKSGELSITQRIPLQRKVSGPPEVLRPLTGLPNTAISGDPNAPFNDERAVDLLGNEQPLDEFGGDFEGIAVDPDGSFWMADEYRPAIYHFSPEGTLIDRFVPKGTAVAAGFENEEPFGIEALPQVLGQRRQNRGFEAIAYDGGKIYAFMQSPLRNPPTLLNGDLNAMRNIRVVEFNPASQTDPTIPATRQFIYVLDNANLGSEPNTRADKIGDAVSFKNGEFLVLERDDDSVPGDSAAAIEKKIYRFNLAGATDVTGMDGLVGSTGKTVDQLTVEEMVANGIHPIQKILHVDLNEAGYNQVQKVEGLALIDPQTLAVLNDNDFGVANIIVDSEGTFTLNYHPEPIQLGIIETSGNGLDASDRDAKINIRQWPVKGMYLPDAIASYKVGGKTFFITANEGDAREYETFVESVRIGSSSVTLDPAVFPDAMLLKNNANLGRLNITTTMGRNSNGFYQELVAFGARSFSIWDVEGRLQYDSGDALERITADAYPANFNASNTTNEFDNRSDDKGPEPEGVVVGKAFGTPYAFVGLERIGGVAVFDVSEPTTPKFVQYVNRRDFDFEPETEEGQGDPRAGDLGPEGLLFIDSNDSPNGKPLLIVGNEISGTTTIYEIKKIRLGRDQ